MREATYECKPPLSLFPSNANLTKTLNQVQVKNCFNGCSNVIKRPQIPCIFFFHGCQTLKSLSCPFPQTRSIPCRSSPPNSALAPPSSADLRNQTSSVGFRSQVQVFWVRVFTANLNGIRGVIGLHSNEAGRCG